MNNETAKRRKLRSKRHALLLCTAACLLLFRPFFPKAPPGIAVYAAEGTVEEAAELPAGDSIADKDALTQKGEAAYAFFSFRNLYLLLADALKEAFSPSLPLFAGLLGMLLICAVSNAFEASLGGFPIGNYVSALCFSGFCFSTVQGLCGRLSVYTEKLRDLVTLFTPTLVAVSAADGALSAKTVGTGMIFTLTAVEWLTSSLILPCVKILFVLSAVSCISEKGPDLRGISASLRTFSVFMVSLSMTAIVTVLHFQNVIAKAVDSVGLRAVRFVSANFIPLVGSLVGESVKTVTEALRAVRGIAGAAGVAAVISASLPPLAALAVFKAELVLCTCFAKTLGCARESAFLSETGGLLNVLNAAVLASSIGFSAVICIAAHAA